MYHLQSPMKHVAVAILATFALIVSGCLNGSTPVDADDVTDPIGPIPASELSEYWADRLVHRIGEIQPVSVTAADGVELSGHVYLPDGDGPFATVLEYSPYFNSHQRATDAHVQDADGGLTMTGNHQPLLEAGFAVALVNLRGTGPSGGCVHWGSQVDWDDVSMVIESLAAEPWSNGNVGMVGTSYPGWTQYMALAAKPASLKAVIPVSGVIDLHSLLTRQGATLSVAPVVTTQWHALYSLGEATYLPTDPRGGEINHAECGPRVAEDAKETAELYASGDLNPYWLARDIRDEIAESEVPILFTNGLTDGEGHILQFEGLWDLIPHENKRMMVGQWGHGGTDHPSGNWALMRVAWFDHWLRDGPPLVATGVVEYQDDSGAWHTTDHWPPRGNDTTLYASDGVLVADESGVQSSSVTFQSVHANACPNGLCTDYYLAGTPDVSACGPHQALYVSPPLAEDVLLAGNFHVNLTLSSTLPDGNLGVFLYRTSGDGICPDEAAVELRRALTDLRHAREPGHHGADFPVASPTEVNLVSHPFASPVKAGERLVLAVGGGALELTPEARNPLLTVTTGPDVTGQVTIPVVEGTLAFA